MVGIPNNVYILCRNVLGKCSEFDTNKSLQAIFITEKLSPFSSGLPEATSRNERIDLCLNYLLQNRHSSGESLFLIFLEVLRDRYSEGNALREELNECIKVAKFHLTKQASQSPSLQEPVNLVGSQRKQFCEALIDAFRSKTDLEMMLSHELDWKLNQIAYGENYQQIAFKLIDYAEARGQLIQLLEAAKRANSGNPKLRNFHF